jgi:hypothetical protein
MSPSTDSREAREFAREIKFRLSPELAESVRGWIGSRLQPDPNASSPDGSGYTLSSLYFDTAALDVFHRRGSYGRSKYRVRRYGRSEVVFLERKMRTKGRLTKRRSIVPLEDLARLAMDRTTGVLSEQDGSRPVDTLWIQPSEGRPLTPSLSPSDGQRVAEGRVRGSSDDSKSWIGRWFQRRIEARRLSPVVRIAYQRTAKVALTVNGPIRLTIDEDLRAVPVDSLSFLDASPATSLLPGRAILELKFLRDMPALFKVLVEEFALTPEPTSKYRLAVDALRLATPAFPSVESDSASQGSSIPCLNS